VSRKTVPEPTLAYQLVDAVRLVRRDFRARATGLGLTPALARLLFFAYRRPGCRQAELAAHLDVTPVTLGRMVDRLAALGYVRRLRDASDRRAARIHVTPRGRPLVTRMKAIAALTEARSLRGFAADERRQLVVLLGRLQANLEREG